MPLVSIIVPVYKVELYLKECIDSVLNQTFKDFELILVDDGSPDNCPIICDEYAKKDNRIVVIHKENGGVSSARNAGLKYLLCYSKSNYVTFLDSDDVVSPFLFDELVKILVKDKNKTIKFSFTRNKHEIKILPHTKMVYNYTFHNNREKADFINNTLLSYKIGWESCTYLFRVDIIKDNKLFFPDGYDYAEDMCFTIIYYLYSNDFIIMDTPLYYYRDRKESMMNTNKEYRLNDLNEISKKINYHMNCLSVPESCVAHKAIIYNGVVHLPELTHIKNLRIWREEVLKINDIVYFKKMMKDVYKKDRRNTGIRMMLTPYWIGFRYLATLNYSASKIMIFLYKIKLALKIFCKKIIVNNVFYF